MKPVRVRVRVALLHTWWRVLDYAYVLGHQALGVVRRGPSDAWERPEPRRAPDVVLVPGVYESWTFLRPLARALHQEGHAVHVVPALGYNRAPVADSARVLGELLRRLDLRDVVVVAHSKGGLIGKLAMLREDPEGRVLHMVAVATPFAGSPLARFVPLRAVRAFVPTDTTLLALAAERDVNRRITSTFSHWDPHIPGGSELAGAAANIPLQTPGHFRVLADARLEEVVLGAVRAAAVTSAQRPSGDGTASRMAS